MAKRKDGNYSVVVTIGSTPPKEVILRAKTFKSGSRGYYPELPELVEIDGIRHRINFLLLEVGSKPIQPTARK